MSLEPPPNNERAVDTDGFMTLPWILFSEQNYRGDTGEPWVPNFVGLTFSGNAPTITGRYYKISQEITFYNITVIPDVDTSATSGTTYVDNFPLVPSSNGFCVAVTGTTGGVGIIREDNRRIYPPSWSLVSEAVTITGFVEAK